MNTMKRNPIFKRLMVLVALGAFVACLGALSAGCGRQGGTITAPSGPAAAGKGTLTIQSLPSKTEVYINGEKKPVGTSSFQLDPGAYAVFATRSGFELSNANVLQNVTITADQPTTISLTFTPRARPPDLPF